MPMTYAPLGPANLSVSRIAFGCMSLKGGEAHDTKLLHAAADAGINLFDTADLYDRGANEERVGKALKDRRKNLLLATKVGNQWRADGSGWDWNPTKAYIIEAVEQSLRRLQTDYIDLYQLHGGTIDDQADETMEAFELLQQQGKILHYGISSIRPNVVRRWTAQSRMASLMVQYSLLDRRPEEQILPMVRQKGMGVLVRGALAQGLLAGKPAGAYLEWPADTVAQVAKAVASASTNGRTATATALHFVLQHPAVTAAVVGIRTPEQLEAAIAALEANPLDAEAYCRLCDAAPAALYSQHR